MLCTHYTYGPADIGRDGMARPGDMNICLATVTDDSDPPRCPAHCGTVTEADLLEQAEIARERGTPDGHPTSQ